MFRIEERIIVLTVSFDWGWYLLGNWKGFLILLETFTRMALNGIFKTYYWLQIFTFLFVDLGFGFLLVILFKKVRYNVLNLDIKLLIAIVIALCISSYLWSYVWRMGVCSFKNYFSLQLLWWRQSIKAFYFQKTEIFFHCKQFMTKFLFKYFYHFCLHMHQTK